MKNHFNNQNSTIIRNILLLFILILIAADTALIAAYGEVPDNPNGDDPVDPDDPVPLIEVVFLLDSTGSMSDEILSVKSHIQNIIEDTMSGTPQPRVRVGIVTYRDHPPEDGTYVYRKYDLTDDIDGINDVLRDIDARGGGDGPEALADGLHAAVNDMDWSDDAKKIIFLIGDAPPHGLENNADNSFVQGCPDGYDYLDEAKWAKKLGISIFTIGCSGIEDYGHGVDVFKEIASITGGEYKPLEYRRVLAEEYYETEKVAPEYAVARYDTTYDSASGTILVSDLNRFAGVAMKSAAMEAGVSYPGTENGTDDTRSAGNDTGRSTKYGNIASDIPGMSAAAAIISIISALLITRRYS